MQLVFWLAIFLWAALGVAVACHVLRPAQPGDELARYDNLRRSDFLYRYLGSWIARVAARIPDKVAIAVTEQLRIAAEPVPWNGAEFLARSRVAGWAGGASVSAAAALAVGWPGIAIGALFALWYPSHARRDLADRAAARLARIRARLSFAAELMVAQLAAGASPAASVRSVAAELVGHPAGDELGQLSRAVDGGQTLASAARKSVVMSAHPDLRQVAVELARGEETGVALVSTFRSIARQLRERDAARNQKLAEEARAKLSGPVLLISLACILVITVPFILHAFEQF